MPPSSRGEPPRRRFSGSPVVQPSLETYLDGLPSPTSTIRAPRSSDEHLNGVRARDPASSPTRAPSHLNQFTISDVENGEVTLDDDDFQSHYSRHSSPASSSTDSEQSDQEMREDYNENNDEKIPHHRASQQSNHPPFSANPINTMLPPPVPPPIPLYPPFYNRPPTPLPPSPSLTSLLRPPSLYARSSNSTHPPTPDSSDAETPADTEAAVSQSFRRAKPLPPTSPRVPTYEYYGFAVYLGSSLAFGLYILWSYAPATLLHWIGITYYPNRWWSLAFPAWVVMLLVFIYVALLSYNVEYLTLPMASLECMIDDAANVAVVDARGRVMKGGSKRLTVEAEGDEMRRKLGKGESGRRSKKGSKRDKEKHRDRHSGRGVASNYSLQQRNRDGMGGLPDWNWRTMWNEGTDAVMDVPLGGVCEVLYGEGREAS